MVLESTQFISSTPGLPIRGSEWETIFAFEKKESREQIARRLNNQLSEIVREGRAWSFEESSRFVNKVYLWYSPLLFDELSSERQRDSLELTDQLYAREDCSVTIENEKKEESFMMTVALDHLTAGEREK